MSILNLNNISFSYNNNYVFQNISLEINQDDIVLIEGKSGSGKSTLINLIAGYIRPQFGIIRLFDKNLAKLSRDDMAKLRRKIGIITQSSSLLKDISVLENVMMPLLIANYTYNDAVVEAKKILSRVFLEKAIDKSVLELSGGEMQRVGIARALVNNPQIILADEATANLDDENAENILSICIEMAVERKIPILWVTHNPRQKFLFNKNLILSPKP